MEPPKRPSVTSQLKTWRDASGNKTPGISLLRGGKMQAHLTWSEARAFADRLHDLCDANGNPEERLPSTRPDNE